MKDIEVDKGKSGEEKHGSTLPFSFWRVVNKPTNKIKIITK